MIFYGVLFVFLQLIVMEDMHNLTQKSERINNMSHDQSPRGKNIMTDEEIISLYWQRQEKAIDATDTKYGNYLYTIAYNILNDNMDSEECLNDTYLGTWNSIPPHRPSIFQAFLSKIMRNNS